MRWDHSTLWPFKRIPLRPVDTHVAGVVAGLQNELKAGQRLEFNTHLYPPPFHDETRIQDSLSAFAGSVLILSCVANGHAHTLGTGFLIGPGLALAASHVIDEHRAQGHFEASDFIFYAWGIVSGEMQCWALTNITFSPGSDYAILCLTYASTMPPSLTINSLTLSTKLPEIGEEVTAVGFRPTSGPTTTDKPNLKLGSLEGVLLTAVGRVIDVYPQGRDSVILPQPCFAAEMTTVGAMSGGPVFDASGHVVGHITSSTEPFETSRGLTFVSMNWDALMQVVQPSWPPGFWKAGAMVRDLVSVNEAWRLTVDSDRTKWTYQYSGDRPSG